MAQVPSYRPPQGLQTKLEDFKGYVNRRFGLNIATYSGLHAFSVYHLNDFWTSFWDFSQVIASQAPTKAIDERIPIDQFPKFFTDARLNFAENILERTQHGLAIISANEDNLFNPDNYSWPELRQLVRCYSSALRVSGFQRGDTLAIVGGNCAKSLALLLATGALGGIFSSFSTDVGDKALSDRLILLKPKFLFVESVYSYNGKKHNISHKIDSVVSALDGIGQLQLIVSGTTDSLKALCTSFEVFLSRDTGAELKYEQVPFNTPFVVMFSSGTTGAPKGIVQSHGGLILNGLKEFLLHSNLTPQDVHYQYTSVGWVLWNVSVGALFTGTTLILYDGSPFYPDPESFLKAIFSHNVTCFGAGPRYYSALQKQNIRPKNFVPRLHSIVSTGAVLTPALANWIAEAFGPVCQISMSGGTELAGSFVHGTRSLPSYPGEIAVKALGMDIAVYGPDGTSLPDGESGELVCRKPFPNMPTQFLDDPERKRYFNAYFTGFPHVWTHGDYIRINKVTQGIYILGRSDGVLNPSGVRFGSSEVYSILGKSRFSKSIVDSIVVGQQRVNTQYSDPAEQVILFIKCTPSASRGTVLPKPELEHAIRDQISKDLSRRHVPTYIFEVDEIPYNVNGKKLEIPVKAVLCGGAAAMAKLKVTKEELVQIAKFLPFYEVERVVKIARREQPNL